MMSAGTSSKAMWTDLASFFLRLSLGAGFLSAVADRLGVWGPAGTPSVAWGNFHNFLSYTAKLNPWSPASLVPVLGWAATLAETVVGIALTIGICTRAAGLVAGLLTLIFALSMTFVLGVHVPLNYGVFVYSAAAFLLACTAIDKWTLDVLFRKRRE
ncbi:DoxX family protein [Alloacidobacterium sp.]|uniref:DoxX family protein n=1 Tax=Alloacidobacterium sp. TaxID=2951999 RepID=UPI002D7A0088|nr:DoxX family protein [Alloacidobacterium sp.]